MLRRYAQAVWRRKWLVLAPVLTIPALALVLASLQEPRYEVSADVLVNRQEVATTSLIGQTPAFDDPWRAMDTQSRLARVPVVLERTVEGARVDLTPDALRNRSSVYGLADLLRFTVADADPAVAARVAGEYARQFVRYRRELDTEGLGGTLAEVRGQIEGLESSGSVDTPLYERLADRERQLESLLALRASNVSVVQSPAAGDAERVAPRPRRDAALALGAALVLGLVLVFLAEGLATRPRSTDEFEALLDMPFLARLRVGSADGHNALRTSLELANGAVGARTIMVTSPRFEEETSATTLELALTLARAGRRVVLVDLDLRRGSVSRLLGLGQRPGVTAVLRGQAALEEAIVAIPVDRPSSPVPVSGNGRASVSQALEALAADPDDMHPAELLSSPALSALLEEVEARADVVLVDVPPLLEAPDAAALAPRVDALLLVVGERSSAGPVLAEARRALDFWPVAKLGFALVTRGGAHASVRASLSTRRLSPRPDVENVA